MVVIKNIVEPTCKLYLHDNLVGDIVSSLQLNDCILQINAQKLDGYKVLYDDVMYTIQNNGRIKGGSSVYPLYSEQMKELMGF